MTPKEKAEKLLKKMLSKNPNIQDGISRIDTIQAKLCAIVAVDEILQELKWVSKTHNITKSPFLYFEQVKQEIENL